MEHILYSLNYSAGHTYLRTLQLNFTKPLYTQYSHLVLKYGKYCKNTNSFECFKEKYEYMTLYVNVVGGKLG